MDAGTRRRLYRDMLAIRLFEERVADLYAAGEIPGFVHLATGQEATAVGAAAAMAPDDQYVSTHRGHGHHLARGADPGRMLAELMGREDGYCHGRGGCLHITAAETGSLGANGIVAAGTLIAAGAGLSARLRQTGRAVVCFLGEGATGQGMFHEALNLAALWRLPVVYLCENNLYAEATPFTAGSPVSRVVDRAGAYGIPAVPVDGNDVEAVRSAVAAALARARRGEGPTLIEAGTYRWRGHYEGDPETYRSREEVARWRQRCPVQAYRQKLLAAGVLSEAGAAALQAEADEELASAIAFAQNSPLPDPAEIARDVFAPDPAPDSPGCGLTATDLPPAAAALAATALTDGPRLLTGLQALQEAMAEEMARDGRVFLLGEDQAQAVWGVTGDLYDAFGPERVRNTPISENAIVGAAVGAAMTGLRPVAEIMFQDFLTACMDPLINQAAKIRYMTGGQFRLPLVVRSPGGCGFSAGAQHSQWLGALFLQIPGLKVAAPATAADLKGMLKAAIRDDNPVLFLEHKSLYYEGGEVPGGDHVVPLGVAAVHRTGTDATVVALSAMVPSALRAAEMLAGEGIAVEVVDPRSLVPLDTATILASVRKTGRLIIVEEGVVTGGFGAEVAARAAEEALADLRAPVIRLGAPPVPIPFSPVLENLIAPSEESIAAAVRRAMGR